MNRITTFINYLDARQHERKYGHLPKWIELNHPLLKRQCVNCLKGGHRPPRYWSLLPTKA